MLILNKCKILKVLITPSKKNSYLIMTTIKIMIGSKSLYIKMVVLEDKLQQTCMFNEN
jgi:hypothetical protein